MRLEECCAMNTNTETDRDRDNLRTLTLGMKMDRDGTADEGFPRERLDNGIWQQYAR